MPFDWVTSSGINFSSNGVRLFQQLERAGAALTTVLERMDKAVASVDAAFKSAGVNATGAADGVSRYTKATRAATTASNRAAKAAMATSNAYAIAGRQAALAGGASGRGSSRGGGHGIVPIPGPYGAAINAAKFGAEVAAGTALDAVYEASKLQRAMIGIQNATGATDQQRNRMQQSAYDLGDRTGMSAVQAADLLAIMARSSGGVFAAKDGSFDAKGFTDIAPTLASIAKIQNMTRGVSVDSSATTLMQLVHLFRSYKGDDFKQVGDQLTRLSEMMPDSLNVALKQFTYFLPQFKALGISNQDSIASMALLDRMGYGRGKGGTNISDMIAAGLGGLQLTQHAQTGKDALLKQIGVVDSGGKSKFFTDNKANLTGFLEQLNKFATTHGRSETYTMFKGAFGIQGSRIADLAMDKQFPQQLKNIKQVMGNKNISLDEQWKRYDKSTGFQEGRAWSNFQSLITEVGMNAMPGVTKAFKDLGDVLHDGQKWLHAHKEMEQQLSDFVMSSVRNTEQYLTSHREDFVAIGKDIANFAGGVFELGKMLGYAIGPLTTAARVVADIATLNVADLGSVVSEFRVKNVKSQIGKLGSHDQRVAAWLQYQSQFGNDGIPASVLRTLPRAKASAKHTEAIHSNISAGPMGATSLKIDLHLTGLPNGVSGTATASQPRSAQGTSAANRPHPNLPIAVTVGPAR